MRSIRQAPAETPSRNSRSWLRYCVSCATYVRYRKKDFVDIGRLVLISAAQSTLAGNASSDSPLCIMHSLLQSQLMPPRRKPLNINVGGETVRGLRVLARNVDTSTAHRLSLIELTTSRQATAKRCLEDRRRTEDSSAIIWKHQWRSGSVGRVDMEFSASGEQAAELPSTRK